MALVLAAAAPAAGAQHEHHEMGETPYPPGGSGTAWLPASAPLPGWHVATGSWRIMVHGSVFLQFARELGTRGNYQLGSVNWAMAEAVRPLAGGELGVRAMASAEPLTLTARGYPQLLQVAQPYKGGTVTDRMHPHEMISEAALTYQLAVSGSLRASLYVAAVGEPALGPVAYMHRPSAVSEPAAPLGHHAQDVTHESFGVATLGLFTRRIRIEGSLFNGAHPDEVRTNLELSGARINATAGRLTVNPSDAWSIAISGAYLPETGGTHAHGALHRLGASVLHVTPRTGGAGGAGGAWATTLVWGANVPTASDRAQNSVLLETDLDLTARDAVFARVEYVTRTDEELDLVGSISETVNVGAIGVGYARVVATGRGWSARLGVRGNAELVPEQLRVFYGSRMPLGFTAYLQLRPK